jgi:hypothetical protein
VLGEHLRSFELKAVEMEITIFYAWQSDQPGKVNHFFIRDAALDACARISEDKPNVWTVKLDSDTQGEAGMCDIPNTILKKIENSDIMLADLTLVGDVANKREKRMPNPNVAFELGYAAAKIGFESLIGVMNEAFGTIDGQMFDTKRRGCMTYQASLDLDGKGLEKIRQRLSQDLEKAIRLTITGGVIPRKAELDRRMNQERDKIGKLEHRLQEMESVIATERDGHRGEVERIRRSDPARNMVRYELQQLVKRFLAFSDEISKGQQKNPLDLSRIESDAKSYLQRHYPEYTHFADDYPILEASTGGAILEPRRALAQCAARVKRLEEVIRLLG